MKYTFPKIHRSHRSRIFKSRTILVLPAAFALLALLTTTAFVAPGAIFTTDSACSGVDLNIYTAKDAVHLNGGPSGGGPGLPDGDYYVRVTEPGGGVLGHSPTAAATVFNGSFIACYQLSAILVKESNGDPGYDTTSNPGGEYQVEVNLDNTFPDSGSKKDNFKVKEDGVIPPQGNLQVFKYYDADTSGTLTPADSPILGWEVHVGAQANFGTSFETKLTPVSIIDVAPDCYTAQEGDANNWIHTGPSIQSNAVVAGQTTTIEFGNVCLGAGGGLTLGYWSNKNGAKVTTGPPNLLPGVLGLCLRNANGTLLGSPSLANFQKFLLSATAANMANMLSAQLAAMHLNVASGGVNGNALVYAPGTNSANPAGFATVNDLKNEANAILCAGGATPLLILSGNPDRARAEAVKTALDKANNNLNFVQTAAQCGVPTTFTYPDAAAPECP